MALKQNCCQQVAAICYGFSFECALNVPYQAEHQAGYNG